MAKRKADEAHGELLSSTLHAAFAAHDAAKAIGAKSPGDLMLETMLALRSGKAAPTLPSAPARAPAPSPAPAPATAPAPAPAPARAPVPVARAPAPAPVPVARAPAPAPAAPQAQPRPLPAGVVPIDAERLLEACRQEGERHVLVFDEYAESLWPTTEWLALHLLPDSLASQVDLEPLIALDDEPWTTVAESAPLAADGLTALTLRCHEHVEQFESKLWLLPPRGSATEPVLLAGGLRGGWTCHLVFRMSGAPQGFLRVGRDGVLTQLPDGAVVPGARLAVGFFAWGKRQVRLDDFAPVLSITPVRGTESDGLHHVWVD